MPGWLLAIAFAAAMCLVVYGWSQIVRLAYRLEKQRFGWSDEEAMRKFFGLRRPRGVAGRKRMQRYIREDVRDYAEETGQAWRHRYARLALSAGYALAVASVFAWFLRGVIGNGGGA